MNPAKVSIITPTFNRKDYILSLIERITKQSYPYWELVIVDDGSEDETEREVKKLFGNEHRVRLIPRNREPKGAPTCRNIGVEQSTGDYLIFLDSDDLLAHFTIEQRLSCFEKNNEFDFLVFRGLEFSNNPGDREEEVNRYASEHEALDYFLERKNPWQTSAPIWKKSSYLHFGLEWNEQLKMLQDVDLHVNALLRGMSFKIFYEYPHDYYWRTHADDRITDYSNFVRKADSCIHFLHRFYQLYSRQFAITEENRGRFADYYFYIARVIASEKKLNTAIKVWKAAKKLSIINVPKYRRGVVFLTAIAIFYRKWMARPKYKEKVKSLFSFITGNRLGRFIPSPGRVADQ